MKLEPLIFSRMFPWMPRGPEQLRLMLWWWVNAMVTRELTNRGQPLSYQFWIIFHTMKRRLYLTVLVRRIINGLTTFPLILWENRNIRMRYYCIIEFDSQHYIVQAFNKVWNMYGVTYLLHCIINWPNDYLFQPKSIILVRLPNIMTNYHEVQK